MKRRKTAVKDEGEKSRYRCLGAVREETECSLTLTIVAAAS